MSVGQSFPPLPSRLDSLVFLASLASCVFIQSCGLAWIERTSFSPFSSFLVLKNGRQQTPTIAASPKWVNVIMSFFGAAMLYMVVGGGGGVVCWPKLPAASRPALAPRFAGPSRACVFS